MKKAILFARVSTRRQEEEGLSLENIQVPRLEEYAKEKDLEIVERFVFQKVLIGRLEKDLQKLWSI
jgi:DNA invertase Pin-like site-specific DNA recombinase